MRSMQGTPYHIEGLRRSEDDPRRYWGRCRHVDFNTQECTIRENKKCTYCTACIMYAPVSEEEFKKRQREKQHLRYLEKKQMEEAKAHPDFYVRKGAMVSHDRFGEGRVFSSGKDYIIVEFGVRKVRFSVPDCFMDSKFRIKKKK